jgi:YVTN family beta-propeller protein
MITCRGLALSIPIAAATLLVGVGRPIAQPLQLEAKIPLGEVRGRIDHMAIDLVRQRLFVAELGNDTVGIVDLKNEKVIQTISGLREPQGLGYMPAMDALYVANAGDGSVRVFAGADYAAAGRIDLGEDADNIRVDSAANQILVGYGSGGWWQSMPELSRGSPTFRCRFIRKGFNSIPQVVRSSSISPSHIRSQLWIADQESWRQPGPSRSPATISQWRSVETRNRSSPFSATPRSSACSRSKTVRSCPAWAAYVPA